MSAEILGVLVARVSGQARGTFMRERIFDPLGMNDTGFWVPPSKLARLPTCYRGNPVTGQTELHDPVHGFYAQPPSFEAGAGGLASTADDMLAFGRMLLERGTLRGERILSRAAVELIRRPHRPPGAAAIRRDSTAISK